MCVSVWELHVLGGDHFEYGKLTTYCDISCSIRFLVIT